MRPWVWAEGGSGIGSDPRHAAPYLEFLAGYIRDRGIRTVLDLGCGDGRLARAADWGGAQYSGLDFPDDIRYCRLPGADLAIMKDVLQHWPVADIQRMALRLGRFPHVLIVNCCTGPGLNADIGMQGFRPLDLSGSPFFWAVKEVFRWTMPGETKSVHEITRSGLLRSPASRPGSTP